MTDKKHGFEKMGDEGAWFFDPGAFIRPEGVAGKSENPPEIASDEDFRRGAEALFRLNKLEGAAERRRAELSAPFVQITRLIKSACERALGGVSDAKDELKRRLAAYAVDRLSGRATVGGSGEDFAEALRSDFAYIKRKISFEVRSAQKVPREFLEVDESKLREWAAANKAALLDRLGENPMEGLGVIPGVVLKIETEVISR